MAKTIRINEEITPPQVRLIDETGKQLGIVPRSQALARAEQSGLDLVEISPNAEPPVCKVMNYGKHLFQQNKADSAAKKKQKQVKTKQLRLRPMIDEGDYQVKIRSLTKFVEEGNRVEISVRFRGREMAHRDLGVTLLQRIVADLQGVADVDRAPSQQGRQLMMVLLPHKK